GHRRDFDRWRQLGCTGWAFEDVLPYFKRSECFADGGDAYHGSDGPLQVMRGRLGDSLFDAFLAAGLSAGYPNTDDYNGPEQEGFATLQQTIGNGRRSSAASAFLRPAERRENLTIVTDALVGRVAIAQGRAVGVAYAKKGQGHEARAAGEVILAGGAVNSPQLLMLSGIGPADHLRNHGIDIALDLPGVGQNLQDHPSVSATYARASKGHGGSAFHRNLRVDRLVLGMLRARLLRTGFATTVPSSVTGFVKSGPELELPDMQFFCRLGGLAPKPWFPLVSPPDKDGFTLRMCHLRPEARGEITLRDADPATPPRIVNNLLGSEADRRVLRHGVKLMRELVRQPTLARLVEAELEPGPHVQTDDEIDAFVRQTVATVYHPCATARMGHDVAAVVDDQLRVQGIDGLRVVDASVMPDIVGGNLNAVVFMIAEKASDMILGRTPLAAAQGL
ncbi:MAG: GMC family oxidoreductase N-terminal domain-containing protein, partial [Alphaproteobacteria bacterium]|nr:GMC family oxidoreductase N-terminal domain-containing protein [Alphaproteobacteria bacterium]